MAEEVFKKLKNKLKGNIMKQFEYLCKTDDRKSDWDVESLNKLGLEGWEIFRVENVNSLKMCFYFKREVTNKPCKLYRDFAIGYNPSNGETIVSKDGFMQCSFTIFDEVKAIVRAEEFVDCCLMSENPEKIKKEGA